jgi:hypothetical protein
VPKEFQGQTFEKIITAEKHPADFMTLQEISQFLGAKVYYE